MMSVGRILRRELNPAIAAVLSALVLIGVLGLMVQGRAAILRDGTEIVLETRPVDPRDLMRGDYVFLQYEGVSQASGALFNGEWPQQDRYTGLWLTLVPGADGRAQVTSISLEKPDPAVEGAVYMKSKPLMVYKDAQKNLRANKFNLAFGIERFYVPEGEGLEIEKARNARRTTVAVRVSADGVPQIARLMIDGEPLYEEPLY